MLPNERMDWIDVSVTLHDGMVHWPDNPPVRVGHALDLAHGDPCTVSNLSFGAHTGTHVDAPAHFVPGGAGIDKTPLSTLIGTARVLDIADRVSVKRRELEAYDPRKGERLLLRTANSERVWKTDDFVRDYVFLANDGARLLAERGVVMVGIDYLSIGSMDADDCTRTHRVLLEAGICIVEGLDLSRVPSGTVDIICLPLRISHGDGAPARVVVRGRTGPQARMEL
jgi:arylformamidase